ncbi:MAG TPA: dihydroneopterin aldolase family protein [Thermoplasmata archaeon]|nr:dihydroneopterin aldolase family protein [Thermoplasmata archaeon]
MPEEGAGPRLTPRERLLFEAGIKLGGVFHQYIGVPVAPKSAAGLARAIADAVRLQPYVVDAEVRIRPAAGGPTGGGRYGYRYLSAEMLRATVHLRDGELEISARVDYVPELRYPLMRVTRIGAPRAGTLPTRRARRSARTSGRSRRRTAPSAG